MQSMHEPAGVVQVADLDEIDIHSTERYATQGYPWAEWDLLRAEAPVFWYDRPGLAPFWSITRHADLHSIGSDGVTFVNSSSRLRLNPIEQDNRIREVKARRDANFGWDPDEPFDMLFMNGRRHLDLRLLMARHFTPARCRRMADALAAQAQRFVGEFRAALAEGGRVDLVEELSVKLPLGTICEMVGVPVDDWKHIHRWTDSFFATDAMIWANPGESLRDMRKRLRVEFFDYLERLIAEKRANPGDDLASILVCATVDGKPLTQQQLHGYITLLFGGGNETTRNATTRGIVAFLENRTELDRFLADPSGLIESTVEELLRFTSPVIHFMRTAAVDVTLHGQRIRAGDDLVLWYPSGNRDEAVFTEPYRFDITRRPNYHLAFGHGPHFCLGANLARWELRALFTELARTDVLRRLQVDGPAEHVPDVHVGAIRHLPVVGQS